MMIELVYHDMGERGKARLAARDRLHRRRRLDDPVAGAAAILGPHGADDAPLDRGDVELLERTQRAAAIGTGAASGFRLDPPFGARQMIGQCAHRRYPFGRCPFARSAVGDLSLAFELFQGKLELLDLERELLGGPAEGHAAELGELVAESIDQRVARRESRFELGDPGVLVDAGRGWFRHPEHLAKRAPRCQ